jgi:hypothetical protein
VDKDEPKSQLVYSFPGNWCGVPTIVDHYLVQSVPAMHGLIVLDISNAAKPVEVSRLRLTDTYSPHWTAWGPKTQRLVVTSSGSALDHRLYLLKLEQATGAISWMRLFVTLTDRLASASTNASGRTDGGARARHTAPCFTLS